MAVCIILGILFMLGGALSHIMKLIRLYGRDDKSGYRRYYSDPRDNDYDDEYKDRRR